jgi:hypothetical protein
MSFLRWCVHNRTLAGGQLHGVCGGESACPLDKPAFIVPSNAVAWRIQADLPAQSRLQLMMAIRD